MARRKGYLTVNRKKHGILWWLCIGWWERPLATIWWVLLANIGGFKGIEYKYYK